MTIPRLEINNLHKIFEVGTINENHVLKGIDLTLYPGDFVTVIGGNGAGKSTLLNAISGTFLVDKGFIKINGQDITSLSAADRAPFLGYVFQDPQMGTAARLTIEENLAIASRRGKKRGFRKGVKKSDRQWMREELSRLDLGLENRLTTDCAFLSGGQRQALTLLMATLENPEILLLDEHTAALDPKTSEMVLSLTNQMIVEQNLTALMITHNMQDAIDYGNRLVMLDRGRIVLDLSGESKKNLTVEQLMELFHQASGHQAAQDSLVL